MSTKKIIVDQCERRSFVYRNLATLSATWEQNNGYALASIINDVDTELHCAHKLALCDLSHLQRIGFKGNGTNEWLAQQNVTVPPKINSANILENGCLTARLGSNDILIMDNLKAATNFPEKLQQQWHLDYAPGNTLCGYIMPRQDSHACFYLTGIHTAEMFSKLCAVDLRSHKFANYMIAQTSLARLGAIIIRQDIQNTLAFLILVENVTAEYCWECLQDAMQEFQGQTIGVSTLANLM